MADTFDVVIIGSGPGGYVAAIRAGQLGLKTAIIEKDKKLGGTCLHRGCIPTKSLLYSAQIYSHVLHAAEFGVNVSNPSLDWAQAQKHKTKVVDKGAAGIDYLMKKNKVTVLKGTGKILGKGKVEVVLTEGGKKETLDTKNIIVATGSVVTTLPSITLDHKRILSSDSILTLDVVPKSLIVLGAGAVGTEFASIFNQVGSDVTLIEYMPNVLPIEDVDVSKELEKQLKRRKMTVMVGTRFEKVETTDKGVKVTATGADGKQVVLEAEYFLSAVGRAPVTKDIGLEAVGVPVGPKGHITVDGMMRTSVPGVFAIGDVTPHPALAHCASAQGIVATEFIAGKNPRPVNYDRVPNATYCYPEVASVGLTEKKAKEKGYDVKTGIFPFSAITKAQISDEGIGFVKIVSDKKYDEVLGVHLIGPHATELLAEACVALALEITTEELGRTVHAHPTLSEIVHEAAKVTLGHPIHI
ncbi:MAG: dihydrolipoyl dehydrogenase [Archangium gephyra]|uniref:Dihydrolipoyl dehydrogenase n=1 Tax=Archangium gephyra TaxID=48 RepID=A0A2W5TNT1_9BACT|nr:MAG: dihydrolipoyl dehydrogenase [Archangium gephyra]